MRPFLPKPIPTPVSLPSLRFTHPAMRLVLQITTPRGVVPLSQPMGAMCVVGCSTSAPRQDLNDVEVQLDLDLARYKGLEQGVARRHAVFYCADDALYVETVAGASTRLNGVLLPAGRVYLLRRGDELELGNLRLTARLVNKSEAKM